MFDNAQFETTINGTELYLLKTGGLGMMVTFQNKIYHVAGIPPSEAYETMKKFLNKEKSTPET